MSKSRTNARFRFERLEERQLMAGDVRAQLVNGTLFLNEMNGSIGADQAVQVFQTANGKIRVEGQQTADGGRTKINGRDFLEFSALPFVFNPLDLKVSLGGGNDSVNVHDIKLGKVDIFTADTLGNGANDADVVRVERLRTSGAVNINAGAGVDVVGVYFSTIGNATGADDLTITSGFNGLPGESDVDGVFIQSSTVHGKTTINTGASADYVSIQFSNLGNEESDVVVIDAGAGADAVELGMPNRPGQISGPVKLAGTLAILGDSFSNSAAESGDDVVRMHRVFSDFDLTANHRFGNDLLEMTNSHGRFITLHGEQGDDTMKLVEAQARERVIALMGADNDTLDMIAVRAHQLSLDGGAGVDQLFTFDMTNVPTTKLGFELVNGVPQATKRTLGSIFAGMLTR